VVEQQLARFLGHDPAAGLLEHADGGLVDLLELLLGGDREAGLRK
jgi:hypothetical protein